MDLLDRLLRGETVEEHDGYYPTAGAVIERAVQVPRPPFVVAADGPRLIDLAARRADAWNTLGGQPMRGFGTPPVSLEEAVAATARRTALLDAACDRIGRPRDSIRRTLLAYRVDPELFASADAFADYVGRYRDVGVDEFIFYWPVDPGTFDRVPAHEQAMERIAGVTIPAMRAASATAG
ncbi:MAG: LLM class flavin-dependent oxidoreductase [Chloroflexota bacterium]